MENIIITLSEQMEIDEWKVKALNSTSSNFVSLYLRISEELTPVVKVYVSKLKFGMGNRFLYFILFGVFWALKFMFFLYILVMVLKIVVISASATNKHFPGHHVKMDGKQKNIVNIDL